MAELWVDTPDHRMQRARRLTSGIMMDYYAGLFVNVASLRGSPT